MKNRQTGSKSTSQTIAGRAVRHLRHALRAVAVVLIVLIVAIPTAVYVGLSIPAVQQRLCAIAARELSELTGAEVTIGRVALHPFDRATVCGVVVRGADGEPALEVERLTGAFEPGHFLATGRLVVDYVVAEGLNVNLHRTTPTSPLNIQGIIDHLTTDDGSNDSRLSLRLNTLSVLDSRLAYDVASAPMPRDGRFSANHICINDLRLQAAFDLNLPAGATVEISTLTGRERSGLRIDDLNFSARLADNALYLSPINFLGDGTKVVLELSPLCLSSRATDLLHNGVFSLNISPESYVNTGVLLPILPCTGKTERLISKLLDRTLHLELALTADSGAWDVKRLRVADASGAKLDVAASLQLDPEKEGIIDGLSGSLHHLQLDIPASDAASVLKAVGIDANVGTINLSAKGNYKSGTAQLETTGSTSVGRINLRAKAQNLDRGTADITGRADLHQINLKAITGIDDLGIAEGCIEDIHSVFGHGKKELSGTVLLDRLDYNGYSYSGVEAFGFFDGHSADGAVTLDDAVTQVSLHGSFDGIDTPEKHLMVAGYVDRLDLAALNMLGTFSDRRISTRIRTDLEWTKPDDIAGFLNLKHLQWVDSTGQGLYIPSLEVTADPKDRVPNITINSDAISGSLNGYYTFSGIVNSMRNILASVMPSLVPYTIEAHDPFSNNFSFDLSVVDSPRTGLAKFLGLPVALVSDVAVEGFVSDLSGRANLTVDAPWLTKDDILIENTVLCVEADRLSGEASIFATTQYPTKKGTMVPVVTATACNDRIDTKIDWIMERLKPMSGSFDFTTLLSRRADGALVGRVGINPGLITFGEDLWNLAPTSIDLTPEGIEVNGFSMESGNQRIGIDGLVAKDPTATLTIDLRNINLIDIFDTLDLDKVLIGGRATGTCLASGLLEGPPVLRTDGLHVENIGYNYCTFGDADVTASYDTEEETILIGASLRQPDGNVSLIDGRISPAKKLLDIVFDTHHVPLGFLQPFMSNFAGEVGGFATGKVRLFGDLKYVDLEGDVFADDFSMKVDYTNVQYQISDSVIIRPGSIIIPPATLRDSEGHTATFAGELQHKFFQDAWFDFRATDADGILCCNTTDGNDTNWFGKIYGNGSVSITGAPGTVTLDATMATAHNSSFTFILSDRTEAQEKSFITFRDRTVVRHTDSLLEMDATPVAVRDFRKRTKIGKTDDSDSEFNLKLQIDATEQLDVTLEMNPATGDRIKGDGHGSLSLNYSTRDDDLRIYGTYTLRQGRYNFTLQDIIIKDFIIKENSSIAFHGDPMNATLNIEAYYSVSANLSDLDESFLSDPELNHTNVPVHAMLNVMGDMRQPEIGFDIEFPTLQGDIYRKVHSIVSTEEMMNQQIIYLLALNRFYTPEYMTSTTKGSELFSVASSTISSQLSNVLGKLSDKWSIAPNLRSDRGDFSDLEVDVALSSRLLNNRLLLNGNFGYRDKSLNTNQFVGDFDIQYLLNRRGTWRLKAYNRYNDQNYYLRTATTTQGVGVMFRHDFDNFMKNWFKKNNK